MLTSELIKRLQKSLKDNGDLPVGCYDEWRYLPVTKINRYTPEDEQYIEDEDMEALNNGDFIEIAVSDL